MLDYVRCGHCGVLILEDAGRLRADAVGAPNPGRRIAFHLCYVCVLELQAKRDDLWGWTYAPRTAKEVRSWR